MKGFAQLKQIWISPILESYSLCLMCGLISQKFNMYIYIYIYTHTHYVDQCIIYPYLIFFINHYLT